MKYKEGHSMEEHTSVSSTRKKKYMSLSKCCELDIKLYEL
jgi:hypothetical protein